MIVVSPKFSHRTQRSQASTFSRRRKKLEVMCMPVSLLDPVGLKKPATHHHVAVATGTRQVHVAGQVALDENGELVGKGDLAAQVAQAFRNVAIALKAGGATFVDVVRMRIYVAGWSPDMMPAFGEGLGRIADELNIGQPPTSMIGVSILFDPEILVEIEATAIVG